MEVGQAMIVAGIGCRRGAAAADIEAAIRAALARAGISAAELKSIATSTAKDAETGIATAASKFGVAITLVPDAELKAAATRVTTRSDRVLALTGVPSLAEAAALAAAGPASRLIASRLVVGAATCALASSGAAQ
jgi:cobalamin biosynthesis protein CbiG